MGCDRPYPVYFDRILLNASQVTNPSIDPLREPIELRTYLGLKPERAEVALTAQEVDVKTKLAPQLMLETPILFSAMSYGSIFACAPSPLQCAEIACNFPLRRRPFVWSAGSLIGRGLRWAGSPLWHRAVNP